MGYTLYNAKRYAGGGSKLDLARAHYHYAQQIPKTIETFIDQQNMISCPGGILNGSIGTNSVIHSHNTFPSMSQKYHLPMWSLPNSKDLESVDAATIGGNQDKYFSTQKAYKIFA